MQIRCFPVANDQDMKTCLDIRKTVFVDEQHVPSALEMDGLDRAARHFGVRMDQEIVGTCRVRLVGSAAKIERVAVLKEHRSRGIGGVLMKYILQELSKTGDIQLFKLSAQMEAVAFYEKLGFRTRGAEYMEAGMPHYEMILEKQG
jgi:predicted GNAT family N-acyltransferase